MLRFPNLAPVPLANNVIGNPPILAFTGITCVALVGHVIFALVAAAALCWRRIRQGHSRIRRARAT